jgi:hypothetical protein
MTSDKFIGLCKQTIIYYYIDNTEIQPYDDEDIQVVWQCKTLQNYKAILMAKVPDQRIFEATYNGDKDELYLDVYQKEYNHKYELGRYDN